MRRWHLGLTCSCSLAVALALTASPAAAEPVQTTLTADANTVGLVAFPGRPRRSIGRRGPGAGGRSARRHLGFRGARASPWPCTPGT